MNWCLTSGRLGNSEGRLVTAVLTTHVLPLGMASSTRVTEHRMSECPRRCGPQRSEMPERSPLLSC